MEPERVPKKFPVTYAMAYYDTPISEDDIEFGWIGCTSVATIAYTEDPNGISESYSFGGVSKDGKDLTYNQWFQIWCMLGEYLSTRLRNRGARDLCKSVTSIVKKAKGRKK